MVADEIPAPVGAEFRRLYDEQNFGMSLPDAMRAMARRVPVLDARFFVTAVLTQRESGGNLSEVLDNLASVMRERFKLKRQIRVISAHGRISAWVLSALPPVLAGILFLLSPDFMRVLWEDPLGVRLVLVAVALQVIGTIIISRIVRDRVLAMDPQLLLPVVRHLPVGGGRRGLGGLAADRSADRAAPAAQRWPARRPRPARRRSVMDDEASPLARRLRSLRAEVAQGDGPHRADDGQRRVSRHVARHPVRARRRSCCRWSSFLLVVSYFGTGAGLIVRVPRRRPSATSCRRCGWGAPSRPDAARSRTACRTRST